MAEAAVNVPTHQGGEEKEERQDEERGGEEEGGGEVSRLMEEPEVRMFHVEELEEVELSKLTEEEWWQCHLGTMKQRMAVLHHHGRLADVILVFPKYQAEMKAHKLVLGMSSPVLEAMLYGPLSKDMDGLPHRLTLEEDTPDTFEWILRYLYRDDTRFKGAHQALSVYEAAHKYQIDALVKMCSQYLVDSVDPGNFPYVFDLAVLHDDADLLHRCYEMAAVRGREVLSSPDLCVLRRRAFLALLTFPYLHVDKESVVFRAIMQWGWYHLDEGPPPPAKPCSALLPARRRLRAVIDDFLPHVRFLAMDLKEFMGEVEKSDLLTPAECLAVVRALRDLAPAATLPSFVSADATRRREAVLNVVLLANPPPNAALTLDYYESLSLNLVQNFTVGATVHLVRLSSTGVCSLREGSVKVWDEEGAHLAKGAWAGNSCHFRRPVTLAEGLRYSVVLTVREAWCTLISTPINVTHKRTVFNGQTQCGGRLRLEYMAGDFLPPSSRRRRQPPFVCVIDT